LDNGQALNLARLRKRKWLCAGAPVPSSVQACLFLAIWNFFSHVSFCVAAVAYMVVVGVNFTLFNDRLDIAKNDFNMAAIRHFEIAKC